MRAHIAMLPRLQAEENLSAINVGLLSCGHADAKDVTAAIRRLESLAEGERYRPRPASPADLARMGIQMTEVPAAPAAGDGGPADG